MLSFQWREVGERFCHDIDAIVHRDSSHGGMRDMVKRLQGVRLCRVVVICADGLKLVCMCEGILVRVSGLVLTGVVIDTLGPLA